MSENNAIILSKTEDAARQIHELWPLLSESEQQILIDNIRINNYQPSDEIYSEGEMPSHVFSVLDGKVKIIRRRGDYQQIIRLLKKGELFGYPAYFSNNDYATSAMVFEESTVLSIPISIFDNLVSNNIKLCRNLLSIVSQRLRNSDEHCINMSHKHIRGRLAEAILKLLNNFGYCEDGHTLAVNFKREDLANMSNMTTANAIRTLSAFAHEGIISIEGKSIKILNEDELQKTSNRG